MLNEPGLTADERRALQMWFRQAIAKVEQEEVTAQLLKEWGNNKSDNHRSPISRRRSPRRKIVHTKQLVY